MSKTEIEKIKAFLSDLKNADIENYVLNLIKEEITKLKEENNKLKQLFAVQLDVIEQNKKLKEENETLSKDLKMCREIGVEMQREVNRKLSVENDNLKKSREVLRNSLIYVRAESRRRSKENDQDEIYYGDYYNEADRAIKADDEIMGG